MDTPDEDALTLVAEIRGPLTLQVKEWTGRGVPPIAVGRRALVSTIDGTVRIEAPGGPETMQLDGPSLAVRVQVDAGLDLVVRLDDLRRGLRGQGFVPYGVGLIERAEPPIGYALVVPVRPTSRCGRGYASRNGPMIRGRRRR